MLFGDIDKRVGKADYVTNTSVFDPVLTELMYKWFMAPGGKVLDLFAGGSVRGIVASVLDRYYTGIDLAKDQIKENYKQAKELVPENIPNWIVGDSTNVLDLAKDKYDFILTCPPYGFLEVYSDDPNDLSNMPTEEFNKVYSDIINKGCSLLKENRFACIVVGEYREKKTKAYVDFVGTTVQAFRDAGLEYHNEIVLLNALGTAPFRAGGYFDNDRKVAKTHQNVLVFYKGDSIKATEYCGKVVGVDLKNNDDRPDFDETK